MEDFCRKKGTAKDLLTKENKRLFMSPASSGGGKRRDVFSSWGLPLLSMGNEDGP